MRPLVHRSDAAAGPPPPPPRWSVGLLHLTTLLAFARQPGVRRRISELYRSELRPGEAELAAALRSLVVEVGRVAARSMAETAGVEVPELLRYCDPGNSAVELTGNRVELQRLDRVWGGPTLLAMEMVRTVRFRWPGPTVGHLIVLCGDARVTGRGERIQTCAVPIGLEIEFQPGTLALMRREPVASLLEAARAAGLALGGVMAEIAGAPSLEVATPVGRLALEGEVVRLNGRKVRLTVAEMQTLRMLAEKPGVPVARKSLGPHIERVVLGLRNKLGDGLITTVYGTGYALESAR